MARRWGCLLEVRYVIASSSRGGLFKGEIGKIPEREEKNNQ